MPPTELERARGYVSAAHNSLNIALRRLPEDHDQVGKIEHILALIKEVQMFV